MVRNNINDLVAFLAVAREKSFTKAAAKIGISQSALSHTIRNLEQKLGVRLLTRTTRAVSPTEAGERLLEGIAPHFDEIEVQLEALNALKDKPSGTIKINAPDFAISCVLLPKLRQFISQYPDIKLELMHDNGLADIVSDRFDAGVRMGYQLANGMISARISPDIRFAVIGAPSYFANHTPPRKPQDLINHKCINYRFATSGRLYDWEFAENGQPIKIRLEGQLAFNSLFHVLDAAVAGLGLAYVPEAIAQPAIGRGEVVRVLETYCPLWSGFYLYYPHRHQASPAFRALLEALRERD
ncbi:TPA: LysR family transcriptional regulator [Citrobacter freundii]